MSSGTDHLPAHPTVRGAQAGDLPLLPAIETRADTLFAGAGIGSLPPAADPATLAAAAGLLVIGDPPVGFARIEEIDGAAHLEQLSVDPGHVRRGLGSALLTAVCRWAAERGYPAVTLVTFAGVAWNAPFYARHGFAPVPAAKLTPGLVALRRHEHDLGMDALGTRVVMRRPVGRRLS